MNYTVIDLAGLVVATLLAVPLLLLPGYGIGRLTNVLGFRALDLRRTLATAPLLAVAVLPALDALLGRMAGIGAIAVLHVLLAAIGARHVQNCGWPRVPRGWAIAAGCWLLVVALACVDLDWGSGLAVSLLKIDMVKHAATVRALVDANGGVPADVFFLRDGAASYYYYFYLLPALLEWAAGGWIDSRAAFAAAMLWTGVGVAWLFILIGERARVLPERAGAAPLVLLLLCVGGVDVLFAVKAGLVQNMWPAQSVWWNEQVLSIVHSVLWVPQHIAGLIASWVGLLVLAAHVEDRSDRRGRGLAAPLLAGVAFASAQGLSVWVTCGTVAAIAVWIVWLAVEKRWNAVAAITLSGVVAAILAGPHLVQLLSAREASELPIAFGIRPISAFKDLSVPGIDDNIVRLAILPMNYLIEMGVLLVGTIIYWQRRGLVAAHPNETGRLLTISAAVAVLIGSCLKSVIASNDLGWRVMLFMQVAAILWTASVLLPVWQRTLDRRQRGARIALTVPRLIRLSPRLMGFMLAAGLCTTAYDFVGLRLHAVLRMQLDEDERSVPARDRELRAAYAWMNRSLEKQAVFQHNPFVERSFAYGLYGRHRVGVSDTHCSLLFGASRDAIDRRLEALKPVFQNGATFAEAADRLRRLQIDYLVVTATDPVWTATASWLPVAQPIYATASVRVFSVNRLSPRTVSHASPIDPSAHP